MINLGDIVLQNGHLLMPHQVSTVRRLQTLRAERLATPHPHGLCGSVLAAVMGSGKTLMTLVYALTTVERGPDKLPALVICSKSLLEMWKQEGVAKFLGADVSVMYLHRSCMQKNEIDGLTRARLLQFDFVFTTYEFVVQADAETGAHADIRVMGREGVYAERPDKLRWIRNRERHEADDALVCGRGVLFKTPWPLVVSDESQRIASFKTKVFQAMMSIYAADYLCLTGTPTKNYATDIWSLMRWMRYHGVLIPASTGRRGQMPWSIALLNHHALRPAIVQVTHEDCSFVMPARHVVVHDVAASAVERRVNLHYLKKALRLIDKVRCDTSNVWDTRAFAEVFGTFTRLRQVAVAPFLIDPLSKRQRKRPRKRQRAAVDFGAGGSNEVDDAGSTGDADNADDTGDADNAEDADDADDANKAVGAADSSYVGACIAGGANSANSANSACGTGGVICIDCTGCVDCVGFSINCPAPIGSTSAPVPDTAPADRALAGKTTANKADNKADNKAGQEKADAEARDEAEQAAVDQLCKGRWTGAGVGSSKMQAIVGVIARLPHSEKVLLFGNFTSSLDLVGEALQAVGIRSLALDGDTVDRLGAAARFRDDADIQVLRITYPVGSMGLNLTCANHVMLCEPWYNHAVTEQAIARAWRFGQQRAVTVHQFITANTIEPEMLKICLQKEVLAGEVMTGVRPAHNSSAPQVRLNIETIARMVKNCLRGNA